MRGRRGLVLGAAGFASLRAGPARATTPRLLWARNVAGEEVAATYRTGDDYDGAAMARLQHLLRDVEAGASGPVSLLLIDMLSVLQEQWGWTRPLVIRSGFRTTHTNARLEGAAPASLHLRGLAADVSVPGIPMADLGMAAWLLSRRLGFMKISLYPGFVHLDVGPQRSWTRGFR
jgi:uncharacterized protein YcbK (DUF882 family)